MLLLLRIVSTLDKLHAKHVLPGFTDRSTEEREIEMMSTDITRVRSPSTQSNATPRILIYNHRISDNVKRSSNE